MQGSNSNGVKLNDMWSFNLGTASNIE